MTKPHDKIDMMDAFKGFIHNKTSMIFQKL